MRATVRVREGETIGHNNNNTCATVCSPSNTRHSCECSRRRNIRPSLTSRQHCHHRTNSDKVGGGRCWQRTEFKEKKTAKRKKVVME
jgi:hypothetical protein